MQKQQIEVLYVQLPGGWSGLFPDIRRPGAARRRLFPRRSASTAAVSSCSQFTSASPASFQSRSCMLLAAERTPAPEARITTPYGDYSSLAVSHGLVTVKENRYKVGYLGYVWSTLGLQQSITIRHNKNHQGTPQTHIHLHTPAITYTYTQTHTHTHNRRAQRACGQKGRETARRRGHAGEWVENSVCV